MFLTDLHVHSNFSDGTLSIPELIDYFGSRRFGAIAITDHICESDTFTGKLAVYFNKTLTPATFSLYKAILQSEAARAWDQYRMVVIPGFELTKNALRHHRSAHVLSIGTSDWVSADVDFEVMVKMIHDQNGLAVVAHPITPNPVRDQPYYLWDRRDEFEHLFDAWEITNGAALLQNVARTKLKKIATSDFHKVKHMTSWKTVLYCERHPEAILEAIRRQEISFEFYKDVNVYDNNPIWNRLSHLGSRLEPNALGNMARTATL